MPPDVGRNPAQSVGVTGHDRHFGTLAGEFLGDVHPDPLRCSGYHHVLSVNVHGRLSKQVSGRPVRQVVAAPRLGPGQTMVITRYMID